jgi:hypothetical protein
MPSKSGVFYLTGLGGELDAGLGSALQDLEVSYTGISYTGDFRNLGLCDQLDQIMTELSKFIDVGGQKLVAVSAGGYLIAKMLQREEYNLSKLDILLLSPGLPEYIPVRNKPRSLRILLGSEDRICSINEIEKLLSTISNSSFLIVNGAGHDLPHDIVRNEILSLEGY